MKVAEFRAKASSLAYRLYFFRKLPLAIIAGTKVVSIDGVSSKTSIRFRWINQNPFKSIYFAALHMAAELSTGIHLFQYSGQYKFSMLLTATSAEFYKKATGTIQFVCSDGELANEKVLAAITKNSPQTMTFVSDALNEQGELVARLKYTWSIKSKA